MMDMYFLPSTFKNNAAKNILVIFNFFANMWENFFCMVTEM